MEHFDISRCADYVYGVAAPSDQEALARHLAEGCEECARLLSLVQRIQADAAREPDVSEDLVRTAKDVFSTRWNAVQSPEWMSLPRVEARLVFASEASRAVAGARAVTHPAEQAAYEAGNYSIEIHVERAPESAEMALVGQIKRTGSAEPLAGAPVLLMANRRVLANAECNQFGEFCLLGNVRRGLRFCIHLTTEERRVEIPLDRLLTADE